MCLIRCISVLNSARHLGADYNKHQGCQFGILIGSIAQTVSTYISTTKKVFSGYNKGKIQFLSLWKMFDSKSIAKLHVIV